MTSRAINNVANAQAKRPCAVSRKKTSSVRMPTHLVRRRPAKYPPKADDSHWVTTSHIAATVPKVVGDGLVKDHGETVARPRPGPRVNNMIVTPKAANAPPNIEAHSTADAELSTDFSATGAAVSSSGCHQTEPSAIHAPLRPTVARPAAFSLHPNDARWSAASSQQTASRRHHRLSQRIS